MEKLADMLLRHLDGILNLLPDKGEAGSGRGGQRQYHIAYYGRGRGYRNLTTGAQSAAVGGHENRIRRFSESRVKRMLSHFLAKNEKGSKILASDRLTCAPTGIFPLLTTLNSNHHPKTSTNKGIVRCIFLIRRKMRPCGSVQ